MNKDWKEKTCEKCEYNVVDWCKRFPIWKFISETDYYACAEYKEEARAREWCKCVMKTPSKNMNNGIIECMNTGCGLPIKERDDE